MARSRPTWTYARLSCGCVRSVSKGELESGLAMCLGRFKEAKSKETRIRDIVHALQRSPRVRAYQCDKPATVEILDCDGNPLFEGDTIAVLGCGTFRTVTGFVPRSYQGKTEMYLKVDKGPTLLPLCVLRQETAPPKRTRKPKEAKTE